MPRERGDGHSQTKRTGLALVVLIGMAALPAMGAESRPVYAVHPLNVVEAASDAEAKHFQRMLDAQVQKLALETVEPSCVSSFLRQRPNHSCEGDETCLAQLGRECHAQRALWVSIAPNSSRSLVKLSGIVVRSDELAGSNDVDSEVAKAKGKSRDAVVGAALFTFLQKLTSMGFAAPSLPAQPAITPPVTSTAAPKVALAPDVHEQTATTTVGHSSALRNAGCITATVGVVALAAAGVIALTAKSDRDQLNSLLDANHQRPNTQQAADLSNTLNSKGKMVNVALVGGGVLTVAGATIAYLAARAEHSEPKSSVNIALVPGDRGGAVVMGGTF